MLRPLFFVAICALFLNGCGCNFTGARHGVTKIGIDPNWYPLDFGAQNSYVNGFTEELLLEISVQSGIEFERIPANWDALFEGMKLGHYQAILSSLPPYEFNTALYDFSHNFLDSGPVLIVPEGGHQNDLAKMNGAHIGVIAGDPAVLLLQKHEGLIVRNYPTVVALLEAVVNGETDGALLDRVIAGRYVSDLFSGKLRLAGSPLTNAGLHLITMKGKQPMLMGQFNKSLALLKKKKRLPSLIRKWQLGDMA